MVKRKRTFSIKESNDGVTQSSDADQGNDDVKRLKSHGSPGRAEGVAGGQEVTHSPLASPTSPSPITTAPVSEGLVQLGSSVPVTVSLPLPDVPLPPPPVVSQTRPTPQLRTSARVLNKQRREETKVDPALTASVLAKKPHTSGLDGEEEDTVAGSGIEKKRRRAWELWSMEVKNIFFESINECGKDFEAIQNFLTAKLLKKGAPRSQIKNKDQVRHFYYRTWHKISKHITFNEGVKKATQELYGLINFGELRKKIGGTLDERKAQKLQELIRKGSTSVRVKGKSVRVRTPICRALKKLNQIEEHREHAELRVPTNVMVEVVPASVHAWCRVQGLAHNPRVRISSTLQRPLSTVISHLQEKWRSSNLKLRETLSSGVTFPLELQEVTEPGLRLMPSKGSVVKPISVQPEEVMKSSCVSLSSHEARLRRRGEKLGRSSKRKDKKQSEKEAPRDVEGSGINLGGAAGDTDGKNVDTEGVELEDLGDMSQEEPEDCSDGEVGCLNSPDGDADEVIHLSPDKVTAPANTSCGFQVKEEPPDPSGEVLSEKEALDPNVRVKEESEAESGDALRQLLALETVANTGQADDDAEVVCIGESTRLTAHVGESQRVATTSSNQGTSGQTAMSNHQQTSGLDDERGLVGTPEPEEEEKTHGTQVEEGTEDLEAKLQRMRCGWTVSTVGGITVGELYLMFGQNKKLCLEYEFEDQTCKRSESLQLRNVNGNVIPTQADSVSSPARVMGVTEQTVMGAEASANTTDVPGMGMAASLALDREKQQHNKKKDLNKGPELDTEQVRVEESRNYSSEEKKIAVENLSGMLAQLLAMARVMMAKSPTETCPCGHVCSRVGSVARSPASGRCQGMLGIGRSPGNTRSPRTGKFAVAGSHSPGINSPGTGNNASVGRSPLPAKSIRERSKPASAKRLIPDNPDSVISKGDGRTGEVGSNSTVPPTTSPVLATTTISTSQGTGPIPTTVVATGSQVPVSGVRVVLGTGEDAEEFKVPVGPAPRQAHVQQANFNSQLNKLLPRFSNRPGRRVMRKNVVVQRQLLPKAVIPSPSVVTMKVLQPVPQEKVAAVDGVSDHSGFIPIPVAPCPTHNVSTPVSALNAARSQPVALSSAYPLSAQPVGNHIIQPMQSSVKQSVVPRQVQQLPALSPPLREVTSAIPLTVGTNAISVNVSGQPLLTVEMPTAVSSTSLETALPGKHPATMAESSLSVVVPSIDNYISSTKSDTVTSVTKSSVSNQLSTLVSQALSDIPDLSTPPGTPQPVHTNKLSHTGTRGSFVRNLGDFSSAIVSTAVSCQLPSPSIFNSALSLDSLPGDIMTNNFLATSSPLSLSSALSRHISSPASSPPPPPCVKSDLSPITTLLTPVTTSHLELSPPPSQTNSLASLLNTPTPNDCGNISSTPVHNISSPTPSISALLSTSPPDLSKSFTTLLAAAAAGDQEDTSSCTTTLPELHIPEGVNLPLLDISLGGTVTLAEQTAGLLQNSTNAALGTDLASDSQKTTATFAKPLSSVTASITGVQTMQESSTDKLLDITLGNSNSNSSFTSLLAAASQGPPTLQGEGCVIGGGNQILGMNTVGNGSIEGVSSFPQLGTTTPSPPSSPSRLLQQSDNQWLNNEVNDFSLSSFLGHFESPMKSSNSRSSSQSTPTGSLVPSLSSVYSENSVDFTATFAEMKAQVSGAFKQ